LTIMINQKDIINDIDTKGIRLSMAWSTENRQKVASQRLRGEAITIMASIKEVEEFISSKISAQDFINNARIFGGQEGKDLGKISLTLESQ